MNPRSIVVPTVLPCLILCTVLGLLPGTASLTVVHFADQRLETAVRETLGKPVGDITDENMAVLTSLTANGKGIRNLFGLEHAINLQVLDLCQNQVSDISPLAGLKNLQHLDLGQNPVGDISLLAGLTNLHALNLGGNRVSDLSPLAGLTKLQELGLWCSEVSDISLLAGLTNLQSLELGGNRVSDLSPLAGLANLQYLSLADNHVSDLSPLAGLANLHSLGVNGNRVSDLSPLAGLTNLQNLRLENNQVSDISSLIANSQAGGIGDGDEVYLQYNYLDLSEGSRAMTDIQTLTNNGATVYYSSQRHIAPRNIHLGWEGEPTTSVTISWQTSLQTTGFVEFGETTEYGLRVKEDQGVWDSLWPDYIHPAGPGLYHQVPLTGLDPGTTYHFRCGNGVEWSPDRIFTTAPEAGSFNFLVVGDTHPDLPGSIFPEVAKALMNAEGDFVIHTGDMITFSQMDSWDKFLEVEGEPVWLCPLMPCVGNHEWWGVGTLYLDLFALPGTELWYSFDYCNAHFVVLSTENELWGPQLEWLREDLATCNATWKFVFFHKNPGYYNWAIEDASMAEKENLKKWWCPIFDQYHVDIAFSGHIHIYGRSKPIKNRKVQPSPSEGTIYVTNGGGGFTDPPSKVLEAKDYIVHAEAVQHFLRLSIDGNELTFEACTPDGAVFDRFEITKTLAPDLVCGSVQTTPQYPAPGEEAEVLIQVRNCGTGPSQAFNASLYIGSSPSTATFPALGPGETVRRTLSWIPPEEGEYNLSVLVDEEGVVPECSEGNNRESRIVTVSRPKPDLRIVSLFISNRAPEEGDEVSFIATIQNGGREDAPGFGVSFELSPSPFYEVSPVSLLKAGEMIQVRSTPWVVAQGSYRVIVTVDKEDLVDEYVEEDNEEEACYYPMDYWKEGAVGYPKRPIEGDTLIIRYEPGSGLSENISSCTIVWGVKYAFKIGNWDTPRWGALPPGSVVVGSPVETPMERGIDGAWYVEIPTSAETDLVNFKFRDEQLVGRNWDNNEDGRCWEVALRGWPEREIAALESVISEAKALGRDVTRYEEILADAKRCFEDTEVYTVCVGLLDSGEYARALKTWVVGERIRSTWEVVEEARQMGVDVAIPTLYLERAEDRFGEGNLDAADTAVECAISIIEKKIQEIQEVDGPDSALLVAILCLGGCSLLAQRFRNS